MAPKKKKSLANKLAKMTDEERARYLQHRADIEEEAKKRKEQLIATFMKKKIKKEEAFSRLNQAKINQNWHQILRKAKCKEMKENVTHMKNWIEETIKRKNRIISKLLEELDEAEEQYMNNFQSHSLHIDNIIEHQTQYIDQLQSEYEEDLNVLQETNDKEREIIQRNAEDNEKYLQMVIYGQETIAATQLKNEYECYTQKFYETEWGFEEQLKNLKRSRGAILSALWNQIGHVVREYVRRTDIRRARMAEMMCCDENDAKEVSSMERKIVAEEDTIETLKQDFSHLQLERKNRIKLLETEMEHFNKQFLKIRKTLHNDLKIDNTKLQLLTDVSYKIINYLSDVFDKGEVLKMLIQTCKKYQTERERVVKWLPITFKFLRDTDEFTSDVEELYHANEHQEIVGDREAFPIHVRATDRQPKMRPKTAFCTKTISQTSTPEPSKISTVENITLLAKPSEQPSTSSFSIPIDPMPVDSSDIVQRCVDSLKHMDNFWITYNNVEVDYLEISEEKRMLEKENKHLKAMIRALLESAALSKSIPRSKVSTRLPTRRSAYSASVVINRIVL